MAQKKRLDILLVEGGFFSSRERAKTSIMAGLIYVANQKIDKPGTLIRKDSNIEVRGNPLPYVSRGGLKLAQTIQEFSLELKDKVVLDIGASTGGFTDCALQNGAKKVYAVDVGYGQLAWSLRQDPRVINMERTNARYLTLDKLEELTDFTCTDVSFISLEKILPIMYNLSTENAEAVALIKPQFEAGKEKVGKKGVVRKPEVHFEVITKILNFAHNQGFRVKGLSFSPIKGPEGNIEYLLYLEKGVTSNSHLDFNQLAESVVQNAHSSL